uniref:Uncharacterized protein n=1 Tax=Ciona intestinalis TaxID=7719 RepID=H2XST0_CIOIN
LQIDLFARRIIKYCAQCLRRKKLPTTHALIVNVAGRGKRTCQAITLYDGNIFWLEEIKI